MPTSEYREHQQNIGHYDGCRVQMKKINLYLAVGFSFTAILSALVVISTLIYSIMTVFLWTRNDALFFFSIRCALGTLTFYAKKPVFLYLGIIYSFFEFLFFSFFLPPIDILLYLFAIRVLKKDAQLQELDGYPYFVDGLKNFQNEGEKIISTEKVQEVYLNDERMQNLDLGTKEMVFTETKGEMEELDLSALSQKITMEETSNE